MKRMRNRVLQYLQQKELQEKRRIKLTEVGTALGVSPNTIGNWIRDDMSQLDIKVLIGLCDYFGVTFHEMLYIEETDDVPPEQNANPMNEDAS